MIKNDFMKKAVKEINFLLDVPEDSRVGEDIASQYVHYPSEEKFQEIIRKATIHEDYRVFTIIKDSEEKRLFSTFKTLTDVEKTLKSKGYHWDKISRRWIKGVICRREKEVRKFIQINPYLLPQRIFITMPSPDLSNRLIARLLLEDGLTEVRCTLKEWM